MIGSSRMVIYWINFFCVLFFLSLNVTTIFGDEPKIVIVGAGAAGIAAASKLLENGLEDVTILEAENRIGGRVFSTQFGDYMVDLGGQWVHGEKGNVAYELAWPLGLLENSDQSRYGFVFYSSSGDMPLTPQQSNNITRFFFNVEESPEEYVEEGKLESMGDVYRRAFNAYFESHPDVAGYKNQFLHFFELIVQSSDSALSWDEVEASNEWGVSGDKAINWKERTYSTILDILMKKYPDPSKELPVMEKTKLNTEVNKIDYSDMNKKVKVHTTNGDVYEADHVIVTPSLGVLKAVHETLFEANLPDEKKHFIENFGFGSVAKIYLLFDHPWWLTEDFHSFGLNILWTDEDRSKRENDPSREWQLSVIGVIVVEHKPNLLCMWLVGKGAREMETMPEDVLKEQINELLHIFDKDHNITEPTQILRTQWYINDHFRGTYSYGSLNAAKNRVNSTNFIKPITPSNPKILFAGEATDKQSFSTVNGAISSGWREANRLLNLYKNSNTT